ncbi:hypothetical protein SAMN05421504_103229 [Amycolatopsis xylanica]|uniref:Uncharacterized protein n=1 Tax=Amycolatopsis xylanica TaxID=589385 RepID=A0A1H3D1Y8_9PSEU|nr:hypothetical protein [Amycolatopsis xylanica]SDX60300.1 hypothetical protein SAMN05421504_103229 [Amycolatopsis xylanica]
MWIIDVDDVSGERVLEFIDSNTEEAGAILAVYNTSEEWSNAKVSISPKVDGISVEFMEWALRLARQIMVPGS